jgi:hypothetical protein
MSSPARSALPDASAFAVLAWLLVGGLIVALDPGAARRIGAGLTGELRGG